MLGDRELNFEECVAILKRRAWWLVLPIVLVPILVYVGSLFVPDQYTSRALVLVEEQQVPDNFVKPLVNEELAQRLTTMQEQILSRTRLQPLIEQFHIFPSEMNSVPMDELVDRMQKMITVTAVRADFGDKNEPQKKGLPGFYISFVASDPHLAQQVCGKLTSMFMEENLKAREQSAEGTTQFLSTQLDDAKRKLDEQDAKLATFKQHSFGQLPDQEQANLSVLAALNVQLDAANQAVARAQQDKTFAQSLLAQQVAAWKVSRTGQDAETLQKKLADLQSLLTTLKAHYTNDYPDVIKTKTEIADVQKEMESAPTLSIEAVEPDDNSVRSEPLGIQQLRTQIHQLDVLRIEKTKAQEDLQKQIRTYQARLQMSPLVEQQYKELTRDYQTALNFYNDLLAKKSQSAMAADLERKQKGEQFRLMDPPNLPESPSFPNRLLFALGGLGGGLALGLGAIVVIETQDKSLRTDEDVLFYLKLPVLTHVSTLSPPGKRKRHKARSGSGRRSRPRQQKVEA